MPQPSSPLVIGFAQAAPVWLNRSATLAKVTAAIHQAADQGASVVGFGECLVPGYPFWLELTDGARGTFCFVNSGGGTEITRAHIGENAYAVDDQTVANAGTCVAGEILDVDDGGVWVRIGTRAP